jgi:hypothetical protein
MAERTAAFGVPGEELAAFSIEHQHATHRLIEPVLNESHKKKIAGKDGQAAALVTSVSSRDVSWTLCSESVCLFSGQRLRSQCSKVPEKSP